MLLLNNNNDDDNDNNNMAPEANGSCDQYCIVVVVKSQYDGGDGVPVVALRSKKTVIITFSPNRLQYDYCLSHIH